MNLTGTYNYFLNHQKFLGKQPPQSWDFQTLKDLLETKELKWMRNSKLMSAFTNTIQIHKPQEIWEEDKIFSPVFIQYPMETKNFTVECPTNAQMLQTKELLVVSGNPRIYRQCWIHRDPEHLKPSSWKPEHPYFCKASHFWSPTPSFPETLSSPSPFFSIYGHWTLECFPGSNSKARTIPLEHKTQNLLISKWKELAYISHCFIRQPPEPEHSSLGAQPGTGRVGDDFNAQRGANSPKFIPHPTGWRCSFSQVWIFGAGSL